MSDRCGLPAEDPTTAAPAAIAIPSDNNNEVQNALVASVQFLPGDETLLQWPSTSASGSGPVSPAAVKMTVVENDLEKSVLDNNLEKSHEAPTKFIPDKVLLDLNLDPLYPDMDTGSGSSAEIARVLESFNAILDDIELLDVGEYQLSEGQKEYLASTMEAFSELLIGGESDPAGAGSGSPGQDEDLLIVVDDNSMDGSESESSCDDNNGEEACDLPHPSDPYPSCDPSDPDKTEMLEDGYESDRPMVRSSMRKLRPVQMVPIPIPTSSSSSATNNMLQIPECCHTYGHSQGHAVLGPTPSNASVNSLLRVNNVHLASVSEPPSLEDNNAIVLDIEGGTMTTGVTVTPGTSASAPTTSSHSYHTPISAAQFQVNGNLANNAAGSAGASCSSDGCASFRPATNLVFRNLHVSPIDLADAETDSSQSENGTIGSETVSTNPSPGSGRGTRRGTPGPELRVPSGRWPHRLSSVLALVGCTLGLNNICRFGLLSVEYGANFTLQFLILSIVFGIPLFTFHMSIGQYLSAGIIDMWKISPIFQGIGIGLVISQAMIGIYTAVGVSWMFIYFRDSFITRYDQYRWGKCFRDYRACDQFLYNSTQLSETVPDYFNGVVLQRSSPEYPSPAYVPSSLKFTVAFNLAVVWMLVFVSLSKGLKSYGKVIHGFILIPITSMLILSSKMVGLVPSDDAGSLFGQTDWSNFFFNSQTWVIAAREVFFTWGLLGACVMQITSHNRFTHSLKSDASIVVIVTTFVLLLTTFLGNACFSVLQAHGYDYVPSSFESEQSYKFLTRRPSERPNHAPAVYGHQYTSFLMGVRIVKPEVLHSPMSTSTYNTVSGYQVMRLATELFPATMALLGSQGLSPFWTVLFYFTFILFGLAQQLTIWYCVIKGVIAIKAKVLKSWETTITFCVCALGFVLGLPLCTEFGIFVEYFLDYTIGSGWWIMVLYLLQLVAVFIVRGAPYCGENIVTVLLTGPGKLTAIFAPLLSFIWNVILPVAMLVLSIASFKSGNIRELFDWNPAHGYIFWPSWTRELGSLIQLLPILIVPFVAIVQSCRYLTNGPSDLFERLQQLYRPHSRGLIGGSLGGHGGVGTDFPSRGPSPTRPNEDPPPKYTPPPSYSTATGARIAKFLRNSLRRSLRRIASQGSSTSDTSPPPPNYASVILEIHGQRPDCCSTNTAEQGPIPILISPPVEDSPAHSHRSPDPVPLPRRTFEVDLSRQSHTLGRNNVIGPETDTRDKAALRRIASDITPREVARLLRASFRRDSEDTDTGQVSDPNHQHQDSLGRIPKNRNFDFSSRNSQNRRSNDSQLTLLSHQSSSSLTNSRENLNYFGLMSLNMSLGIVNPGFQVQNNPPAMPGHLRSSSLTVPLPSQSNCSQYREIP